MLGLLFNLNRVYLDVSFLELMDATEKLLSIVTLGKMSLFLKSLLVLNGLLELLRNHRAPLLGYHDIFQKVSLRKHDGLSLLLIILLLLLVLVFNILRTLYTFGTIDGHRVIVTMRMWTHRL